MLRLLATKDMTADEIAEKLFLKTITVRHHLNMLNRVGMIEEEVAKDCGMEKGYAYICVMHLRRK